jgi:hypothetical protein
MTAAAVSCSSTTSGGKLCMPSSATAMVDECVTDSVRDGGQKLLDTKYPSLGGGGGGGKRDELRHTRTRPTPEPTGERARRARAGASSRGRSWGPAARPVLETCPHSTTTCCTAPRVTAVACAEAGCDSQGRRNEGVGGVLPETRDAAEDRTAVPPLLSVPARVFRPRVHSRRRGEVGQLQPLRLNVSPVSTRPGTSYVPQARGIP